MTVVRSFAGFPFLTFRKPPENGTLMSDKPIVRPNGFARYVGDVSPRDQSEHPSQYCRKTNSADLSIDVWRRYAEPVWWDINQTKVLNYKQARSDEDEKHICPLQLDLIARSLDIWTMPGDVVLSPFAGIGSEGYVSVLNGRKFVGVELKDTYFDAAVKNLKAAERKVAESEMVLFK